MSKKIPFLRQPAAPDWVPEPALGWKIALAYVAISALWVLLSGHLLHLMAVGSAVEEELEILKGWFFVVVTAAMLGFALQRYFSRIREAGFQLHAAGKFSSAVVNGLSAHLVVVDEQGVIVAFNDAWRRFAAENGLPIEHAGLGTSYFAACTAARGPDAAVAIAAVEGIRDVLTGRRAAFDLEYPCHSPQEKRWFHVRVSQTEPIVRVLAEARGAPPRELFDEVMDFVRGYSS